MRGDLFREGLATVRLCQLPDNREPEAASAPRACRVRPIEPLEYVLDRTEREAQGIGTTSHLTAALF